MTYKSDKELKARIAKRNKPRPLTEQEKDHKAKRKLYAQEADERYRQAAAKQLSPSDGGTQAIFTDGYCTTPQCPIYSFNEDQWTNLIAIAKKEMEKEPTLGYGGEDKSVETTEQDIFVHLAAKCAVANKYGLQWAIGVPVVGGAIIRGTRDWRNRLIVHHNNGDDQIFIQVSVDTYLKQVEFRGWAYGKDAKKEEYLTDFGKGDKRTAFGLPCEKLRPMLILVVVNYHFKEGGDVG